MDGAFSLRIEQGPNQGQVYALTGASCVLGRQASNAIVLSDPRASRQHARLDLRDGQIWITDLGSANGTAVNGRALQGTVALHANDTIGVGETLLRLIPTGTAPARAGATSMPSAVLNQPTVLDRAAAGSSDPISIAMTLNGRYRLDQHLGTGGFARVFLATDLLLNRTVAAKVLNHDLGVDPAFLGRFSAEAQAVAKLDHPNILGIYDFGQADGTAYLIMPYVDGGSLYQRLRRQGPLSPAETSAYLRQVGAALDYAHRQRLVHRDLKPQNMLLRADDDRLLLSDFGIAKVLNSPDAPSQTRVMGTVAYMAPEQFQGEVSRASDIYALGCVVFQLLTGRLPFDGNTERMMYGHLMSPVPALREVSGDHLPAGLQPIIEQALAKRPENRFPTAGAFASAFAAAVTPGAAPSPEHAIGAPPTTPPHDHTDVPGAHTPPGYVGTTTRGEPTGRSDPRVTPAGVSAPQPDPTVLGVPKAPVEVTASQRPPTPLPAPQANTRWVAIGVVALLIIVAVVIGGAYFVMNR